MDQERDQYMVEYMDEDMDQDFTHVTLAMKQLHNLPRQCERAQGMCRSKEDLPSSDIGALLIDIHDLSECEVVRKGTPADSLSRRRVLVVSSLDSDTKRYLDFNKAYKKDTHEIKTFRWHCHIGRR